MGGTRIKPLDLGDSIQTGELDDNSVTDAKMAPQVSTKITGLPTLTQDLTFGDVVNIIFNATTGTKHGTASTQKQAWWGATPVVQPAHIADPTGGAVIDAEARTAIDAILAQLATTGMQASS